MVKFQNEMKLNESTKTTINVLIASNEFSINVHIMFVHFTTGYASRCTSFQNASQNNLSIELSCWYSFNFIVTSYIFRKVRWLLLFYVI